MTDEDLQKHDWEKVQAALFDLMEHTAEHEPSAVNTLKALEDVIVGLPEND
jgi:hypothetical protein